MERDVARCAAARQGWIDQVAATRPDVVVVMAGTRDLADRRLSPTTPWAAPGSPEIDDFLRADVADLLGDLAATGTQVVVLSTPPVRSTAPDPAPVPTTLPADPTQAAMLVAEGQEAAAGVPAAGHAENDDARRAAWNSVLRSAASSAGVTFLDADAEMATWPGGALDPRWRADGIGLSPEGAMRLSRWIAPRIRDLQTGVAAGSALRCRPRGAPPAPPPTPHGPSRLAGRSTRWWSATRSHGSATAWAVVKGRSTGAERRPAGVPDRPGRQLPVPLRYRDVRGGLRRRCSRCRVSGPT